MDVVQNMRGQFYFLSIVLYAVIVGAITFVLIQPQPPLFKPLGDSMAFNIYNLENEMEKTFETGMVLGSGADDFEILRQTLANYTRFTREEIAKRGVSISWNYNATGIVSNATLNCSLIVKDEKVKFMDRFVIHKALLLVADAWYSANYTHVNLTAYNETGKIEGLNTGSFAVLAEGGSLAVQPIGGGYYGNRSEVLAGGMHTISANMTDARGIVARASKTFTVQ